MSSTPAESARSERQPASGWVLATLYGWTGGILLGIAFILVAELLGVEDTQAPIALGVGLGVGLAQSRRVSLPGGRPGRWVLATTLGLALPFIIGDIAQLAGRPLPYLLPAYVAIGGLCVGVLQWRLLQPAPALWLVAAPLGWLLAAAAVAANDSLMPRTPGVVGAVLYLAIAFSGGLLLGVTGAVALPRAAQRVASGRSGY